MAKILNTWLLAAAAIVVVAIGAGVIVMAGMDDDDGGDSGSAAGAGGSEKSIYMTNLGMTWSSCEGTVSARLDEIDGVLEHEAVLSGDYVELTYDENQVSVDEIMDALEEVGYRPASHRPVSEGAP